MIPFAIAASRLAPLICLMRIQPLWVWPAPALALILSQGVATALALNTTLRVDHIKYWRRAEALHLAAWLLFAVLHSGQPQPSGGLAHALLAFLSACLSPSLPGREET